MSVSSEYGQSAHPDGVRLAALYLEGDCINGSSCVANLMLRYIND